MYHIQTNCIELDNTANSKTILKKKTCVDNEILYTLIYELIKMTLNCFCSGSRH